MTSTKAHLKEIGGGDVMDCGILGGGIVKGGTLDSGILDYGILGSGTLKCGNLLVDATDRVVWSLSTLSPRNSILS